MINPIRLNVNELPWSLWDGPDNEVLPLQLDLRQLSLNRYPDSDYTALRTAVADAYGLSASQTTLANGSDELIWLCFSVLLNAGDILVTHVPTFGEYERMAVLRGAKMIYGPLENDLSTSLPNLLTVARRSGAKLVVICRPNNPTGELIPLAEMLSFLEAYEGYVLVDEAYIEFADALDSSLIPYLSQYPNLIILRTFSKAYGLAGLRLGYGFASEAITSLLNAQRPPYNVNVVTDFIAQKVLGEKTYFEKRIAAIQAERLRMTDRLQALGLIFFPSAANFILLTNLKNPEAVAETLADKGFMVRTFSEPWLKNCIRFSLGTPEENDALMEVFAAL